MTRTALPTGLPTISTATPLTTFTGVTTALVAKPIGLVIMLPHPLKKRAKESRDFIKTILITCCRSIIRQV